MSALALLPWQTPALREALAALTSSAVLVHGEPGGQLPLAIHVAKAWLCEGDAAERGASISTTASAMGAGLPACGRCTSCRLIEAGTHPDLKVVVPEALQATLGWDQGEDDAAADKADGKKRKPSQEIKVDAVRQVVAFSQHTASRGRAKVVVIHPADRMNTVSANTLLKTLEEPPGQVRFLLSAPALDDVLPTVRSRCRAWRLPPPPAEAVLDWLCTEHPGLTAVDARQLLSAAGASPQDATRLLGLGWTAAQWQALPADVSAGRAGAWAQWPLADLLDTLQKLAHDLSCLCVGGPARYFPADALHVQGDLARLTAWAAELRQARRHADHPWNASLKAEALLQQARRALQPVRAGAQKETAG